MTNLTHNRGELPTAPREAYTDAATLLETAMRLAIPAGDLGSRGAVLYAIDIAEMLALLHVELTPGPNYSATYVDEAKRVLDAHEPQKVV